MDSATYAELETNSYSRTSPQLWCGSCGGSIYIKHGPVRKDELFGAHHRAADCGADLSIRKSQMSDEHKRQAEYHARAGEPFGGAALEVRTTGQTRVDVIVGGRIGIEVQRSALKKAAAVDRTARSIAAGLDSVNWFTDRTSDPQWAGHVPGYRTTLQSAGWKTLPAPRTAGAAGLQMVEAVRCGTRAPCPHQRTGSCGRFVHWLSAWRGLYVDDVVEGLAAGHIRPVRLGRNVQLLSAASIGLYEELTGEALTYDPGAPKVELGPSDRVECDLPLRVPSDAPAPVREWLEAEQARVQAERDQRERIEHEEREAAEREERERQAQRERDRIAAERRHAEAQCRQFEAAEQAARDARARRHVEQQRRQAERQARLQITAYDQRIRQQIQMRRDAETWCDRRGCTNRGRPYMYGIRCEQHVRLTPTPSPRGA